MGPKVGCPNPKRQSFVGAERALLRDAVGDMNEARQGKRKRRIDHQRHSQREGEHMRVGERQHIRMPEAADLRVARQLLSVDGDVGHLDGGFRQLVAAAASRGGNGLCVEASQTGPVVELDSHAPRML